MINRSAVIVRAREPFMAWLQSLPESKETSLDRLNEINAAYLLPAYADDRERERILAQCFKLIFEDQLAAWWLDTRDWPQRRDRETFNTWFDLEFRTLVHDLVDGPLWDD